MAVSPRAGWWQRGWKRMGRCCDDLHAWSFLAGGLSACNARMQGPQVALASLAPRQASSIFTLVSVPFEQPAAGPNPQ